MGETNYRSALKDISWLREPEAILIGWRGSIAHGMYTPQHDPNSIDDKDILSVVIPPIENYFGLSEWGSRGVKELMIDEWDCVGYELKKFVSLLCKGNPNVLGMLWLEREDYLLLTDIGKMLIENRKLFATRQAYHSFAGYAHGQAHRMTHGAFDGYMGQKRKALVDKFGYDCKNAAHLIRLLRMGIEFMIEGELHVKRQDATRLLEIKHGEWTLEKVKIEADRLFALAEESYIRSTLPTDIDRDKINKLLVDIFMNHFKV
jgi:predicted nucleotidyltransferase